MSQERRFATRDFSPLMPGQDDIAQAVGWAHDLRRWAVEEALPLWASLGWDAKLGGFHERLRLDGAPDAGAIRRVRVQARQIYVYSHAAVLGWYPGTELALKALDALLKRYHAPDGAPGFVHTLDADGGIDNALRDSYDHAFILLALAFLARASGDAQVRALVDDVLAFLDEHLAAGDGSFHEGVPRSEPRRQNPHMHLFEAMLALHETIAHPQALSRAAGLRALLETTFIDPATRTVGEYFDADWKPWSGPSAIEPGHHAEWSWLVRRHQTFAALKPDSLAAQLLAIAVRSADPRSGLLPDAIFADGSGAAPTCRCWPQAELGKAWLAAYEQEPSVTAAKGAASALRNLRRFYLSGRLAGAWTDRVSVAGAALADAIPASTFYHVFSAAAEADRVLGGR